MLVLLILMAHQRRKGTFVTSVDVIKCMGRLRTYEHISVGTLGRDHSSVAGLTAGRDSHARMSCSVISGPTLVRSASSAIVVASGSCAVTTSTNTPRRTKSRKVVERMRTVGRRSHMIQSLHPARSWLQTPLSLVTV